MANLARDGRSAAFLAVKITNIKLPAIMHRGVFCTKLASCIGITCRRPKINVIRSFFFNETSELSCIKTRIYNNKITRGSWLIMHLAPAGASWYVKLSTCDGSTNDIYKY